MMNFERLLHFLNHQQPATLPFIGKRIGKAVLKFLEHRPEFIVYTRDDCLWVRMKTIPPHLYCISSWYGKPHLPTAPEEDVDDSLHLIRESIREDLEQKLICFLANQPNLRASVNDVMAYGMEQAMGVTMGIRQRGDFVRFLRKRPSVFCLSGSPQFEVSLVV